MPEQMSELARSDHPTSITDKPRRRATSRSTPGYAPDPILMTITGVLLFVVFMLVIVFRTLYPA